MALAGSLYIEMSANIARITKDMADTKRVVGGAMKNVESAVASAKDALGALGISLSAAGVAAAAMKIAYMTADIVKATAALDDMAEQTGATVEKLSALQTVASIGGHEFGGITDAIGKMIKGLKGADEVGQAAGQALDFLGVKAKDANGRFRDSVEILQDVAKALSKYEDGGNKIALLQDLLGKSGSKYASLLKDMAEEGETQAKVTGKQAAEAEQLEKNWNRLKIAGDDWRRGMVMDITPALNALILRILDAQKEGRTLALILTEAAIAGGKAAKFIPGPIGTSLQAAAAVAAKLEENRKLAIGARQTVTGKIGAAASVDWTDVPPLLPLSLAYESAKKGAGAGSAAKVKDDYERVARQIADGEEQLAKDIAEAWSFVDKEKRKIDETYATDRALMMKQVYEFEAAQAEEEMLREQTALMHTEKVADEMTEFWRKAAGSMQESMSGLFFDVMQGNLKDLSGSFKRSIDQMVANILAAKAATALFGKDFPKGDGEIGGLLGKGLGWLTGGSGSSAGMTGGDFGASVAGLPAYAMGTDYVPRTGLALVHQGEKITPAGENRGGGRGNFTLIQNFAKGTDRATVNQAAARAGEAVQRAMARNT